MQSGDFSKNNPLPLSERQRVAPVKPEPRRRGFAIAGARPLRKYDKKALHSAGNPTLRGCNPTYATACRPTFLYRHKKARTILTDFRAAHLTKK